MIIQIGTEADESRILWKHKESDEWERADIDDLICAYENRPRGKWENSEDCISRQQAIEEIALHDCTNGEVPYFTGKGVQEILKIIPSVEPKGTWKRKGAYGESDMRDAYVMGLRDAKTETTPSAEPVHGEWIEEVGYDDVVLYYECSVCHDAFYLNYGTPKDNNYNFCPNCGAKMVTKENDENLSLKANGEAVSKGGE